MSRLWKTGRWSTILACLAIGCGVSGPDRSDIPRPYVPPAGDYRVTLPGQPKATESVVPTQIGDLNLTTVTSQTADNFTYTISTTTYPEAMVRATGTSNLLDACAQGMMKSGTWTNVVEKPIKLGGHVGREVTADLKIAGAPEIGLARSRLYFVGNRLYYLLVISPKDDKDQARESFLDSFQVLKDLPEVPPAPFDPKDESSSV